MGPRAAGLVMELSWEPEEASDRRDVIKAGFQGSLICRLVQKGLGGEKTGCGSVRADHWSRGFVASVEGLGFPGGRGRAHGGTPTPHAHQG